VWLEPFTARRKAWPEGLHPHFRSPLPEQIAELWYGWAVYGPSQV